jgi:hypothetical protein
LPDARFEAFTAVMKIQVDVFWVVTPRSVRRSDVLIVQEELQTLS